LVFCSGKNVKIIHHPHHDVKTPVLQEGIDELWALIGHGTTALPVGVSKSVFNDHDGATPTFDEIIGSGTLEELKNLKPASNTKLTAHPVKGKKGVVIPPFLTKILMDVDSEDPFVLLKA
jgi:hypothetical protein